MKYKIGYIDENEQQVKLYARKLKEFDFEVIGYNFMQGMTLEELMTQVYNSDIDLLMIDYKLNETNIVAFNGEAVEKEIYENKPLFPHIIFTNKVDQAEPFVEDMKIICDKELIFDEDDDNRSVNKFVTMLSKSIEQYRNHIANKKEQLSALLLKGEKEELNSIEKNELLTLQNELNSLDKTSRYEVPRQLIFNENLDTLAKTRKEAEEFLQSLIERRKQK